MDEKLEQVLHKVELLCEQNEEFRNKLFENFMPLPNQAPFQLDGRLDAIYEYCIEEILRKQGQEFYQNFPIQEIIPTLVDDYVRMEMFHRDDNFGDFCLAAYQQLECICKAVIKNHDFILIASKLMGHSAYVIGGEWKDNEYTKATTVSAGKRTNGTYRVADLLFPGKDKNDHSYAFIKGTTPPAEQSANDLIRMVIYFICFQSKLLSTDYDTYITCCDTIGKQLYQCRNLNHRGAEQTEWQKGIVEPILANKSFYYYKFISAITQFVELFQLGYPNLSNILNQVSELTDIEVREKLPGVKTATISAEQRELLQRNLQKQK